MSQENVDRTYRSIDAFHRRDIDAFLALTDEEVEFTPFEIALQGGDPYRGHEGVRKWWTDSIGAFPDFSATVHQVRDLGDVTLVHAVLHGRGAESGATFERTMWQVVKWRDGKCVGWRAFDSEAEALEAAGLSE